MTQVFQTCREWLDLRSELGSKPLGFVPTMGALHDGHLSLVAKSKAENQRTLVSIFVNPAQFNDPQDLQNYPRTFEEDSSKLQRAGVDFLLYPKPEEIYEDRYCYRVVETEFSHQLCGAHRPGHFEGVLTVVMKLLNVAQADRAYFGEKDYQQLQLIQEMAKTFFMRTKIIGLPTVREKDGLAMSSRNKLLPPQHRELAPKFHQILEKAASSQEAKAALKQAGFDVDYVEEMLGRRFGAVKLGNVRLIDNVTR